jgi:hypothetical protein
VARDAYTLADIQGCTGIPLERLRYALDQRLLPAQRRGRTGGLGSRGRGVPRLLTAFEAFGIACAALLLDAGLRRRTVRACLGLLSSCGVPAIRTPEDVPLYQAFQTREVAWLEVGDQANVRLCGPENCATTVPGFAWRQVRTRAALANQHGQAAPVLPVVAFSRVFCVVLRNLTWRY